MTITRVATAYIPVPADDSKVTTIQCPFGARVIGGGVNGAGIVIEDSYPSNVSAWFGRGTDLDVGGGELSV